MSTVSSNFAKLAAFTSAVASWSEYVRVRSTLVAAALNFLPAVAISR
jgi:hypothetical protein